MEIQRYNRQKAAIERDQSEACFNSAKRRESRTKSNISTISRWMTNKVQPSVEPLYEIAHHLDVDVKDFLISLRQKNCRKDLNLVQKTGCFV